ncbi:hypothetical protein IOK49_04760 [Fervidicoccus fontis]|jgi:hypothetical protein|uniref:Cobalt ECF transporter T component CbiQ n=1 Tax=Fervidicoccus fontis TaxID=683846 RepID=A0A2J6N2M7_9CREN|nr:hypothetical protein [Fervidicoccus fontis]MBE9391384.1 hypothetical protein [Fervidicoccus fontis]PMB75595.1 MAG: hypothetical protein C0188_02435 [Fervidicoccus fontis]HEW64092.1 hypothetical protein [Fervidicoccus fontis]
MEALKKLSEFIEKSYLADYHKINRFFSEADAALISLVTPILVVLSKDIRFSLVIIFSSFLVAFLMKESLLRQLKNTLFFIPLFSLAVAVPRYFIDPSFGIYGLLEFFFKVWAALSFPTLMARCYGVERLASGFASIGIPSGFSSLLALTSIDALISTRMLWNSVLMLQSRGGLKVSLKEIGYFVGFQFLRSFERGERINLAYLSRGGMEISLRRSSLSIKIVPFMLTIFILFIICTKI